MTANHPPARQAADPASTTGGDRNFDPRRQGGRKWIIFAAVASAIVMIGIFWSNLSAKAETLVLEHLADRGVHLDAREQVSRFQGQWTPTDQTMRISQILGDADWSALADALPIRKPVLPASVAVSHFPGMTVNDMVWDRRRLGAQLGVRSDQLTGRGSFRMTNAPLVEIPLLEPTYRFFAAALPSRPQVSAQDPIDIASEIVRGTAESAVEAAKIPAILLEGAFSLPQRLWRSLSQDNRPSP